MKIPKTKVKQEPKQPEKVDVKIETPVFTGETIKAEAKKDDWDYR